MRYLLLGFAAAAAIAAPAAAVQPVTITSAGIYDPGHVTATVGGATKDEYAAVLNFTTAESKAGAIDLLGFCTDLPHAIYVNVGSQLAETLHFHVAPLTSDGYGSALSSGQVRQITGLARLGFDIAHGVAGDKSVQLAAIQQAIWTVEYPTSTFAAAGSNASAQAGYASTFLAEAPKLKGFVRFIASDDGTVQGQATDVGGVPEPASWAMLLVGFGAVGGLARSRRTGAMTTVAA